MIEILGKTYYTDKELSRKYGISLSWFRNQRYQKTGLPYVKIKGQGKVLYDITLADEWFSKNMAIVEY